MSRILDLSIRQRLGTPAIANWLNDHGHRTRRGRPWSYSAVLTVLRNQVYLGEVFFRGEYHTGPHPRPIDREVFDAAQQLLTGRGRDWSKRASNSSEYLLHGLIVCAAYGKHFVGTAAQGNRYRAITAALCPRA